MGLMKGKKRKNRTCKFASLGIPVGFGFEVQMGNLLITYSKYFLLFLLGHFKAIGRLNHL